MTEKPLIIIYENSQGVGNISVEVHDESVWLSQDQMSQLFGKAKSTINEHILNIYEEKELIREETMRKIGNSDFSTKPTNFYNLDVIISVGYRVKSLEGTRFRQWATRRLHEFVIKGFTLDDEKLKNSGGGNYWKELLDRIRDIRSSEKALYRQVLDLYATSYDYNPGSKESVDFFRKVQNKLHYAVNKQTAAETIAQRADADKDFMGLTTFLGVHPKLSEVCIAKNYLTQDELFRLNRMVSAFFDLAEIKAQEQQKMTMSDWIAELDTFTKIYGKGTLENAGSISSSQAKEQATSEYKKYQQKTLSPVEQVYIESLKLLEKKVSPHIKK